MDFIGQKVQTINIIYELVALYRNLVLNTPRG
jgi:hypothetical protein